MKPNLFGAASALSILFAVTAASAADVNKPGHESPAPGTNSEAMSAVKDTTAGAVGTVSAEMTTTTKGFVTAAAISDMYEVAAGKIAAERAQSPAVKTFAAHMVEAHTETTATLKGILKSDKLAVTPPAHVDSRRQGMLDDLTGAKAADFDHRYVVQQIAAHKEAQLLMRGYAKSGDNDDVKKFASDTLPKVEDHLAMVEKIQTEMKSASK